MVLPLTTLTTLNRQQLGEVFKDPRTLLAFERIQLQVATIIPETFTAFQNLDFVVTSADAQIPNAHVITEGANIDVATATGLVTISATPSGANHQIQFNNAGAFGAFTLGGDATINTGTGALTLATVNSNVGTFGDSLHVAQVTLNAKGLATAAASVAIPVFTSVANGLAPLSGGGTANFLRADGSWAVPPGAGSGTVTNVASADGSITVTNPTTTVDLAVVKAPKWTTGRTISLTGDVTYTSPSLDGSGNVTAAATIAAGVVTLAKIANASASSKLLGSGASGSGASYSEITLGTGLTMTGTTLSVSGGTGTVTTTGSPASGNLTKFSGSTSITNTTLNAFLDSEFSSTQGAILYRGASAWQALAAGSAGNVLQTNGAGANPSWAAGSGGGGNFTLLSSAVVVGSSTSQVTFSGITQIYKSLRIVIVGRTLGTDSAINNFGIIINSDTTAAHYSSTFFTGTPGSSTVGSGTAYGAFGNSISSAASSNTQFGQAIIDIGDYSQTSHSISWFSAAITVSAGRIMNTGGIYLPSSLTAITDLTFTAINNSVAAVNWAAGTTFYLYGY